MSLFEKRNETLNFLGGATLLGQRVAVTVIHNIPKNLTNSSLIIRAGDYDLPDDGKNVQQYQDRVVSRIAKHPQYVATNNTYNIAILFWDEPLNLSNSNVNTICLPAKNEVFHHIERGCTASGWGTANEAPSRPTKSSHILKYIDLQVVEKTFCEDRISEQFKKNFFLHETQICAIRTGSKASKV